MKKTKVAAIQEKTAGNRIIKSTQAKVSLVFYENNWCFINPHLSGGPFSWIIPETNGDITTKLAHPLASFYTCW